ncbi:MAG TPA: hypothetical protein VJ325_04485, partial [Thiobacillus sp.]|nr:hypothetical protein [Thiobacillus sp.]
VVFGKFAGGSNVDDLIEGREFCYGGGQAGLNFRGNTGDTIRFAPLSHGRGRGCKTVSAMLGGILGQTTPVAFLAMWDWATERVVLVDGSLAARTNVTTRRAMRRRL